MRISAIAWPALTAMLLACSSGEREAGSDVDPWGGELPISGPWLRERLPPGLLVYHRVPHPLGLLALPKGTMLDTALGSDANIRNLQGIQQGLAENILEALPLFGDPRLKLFADTLRSPVEIAAFGLPNPSALIAMTLDLSSNAELEALLDELSQVEPFVRLTAPLDDAGVGQLVGLPVTAFVRFESGSGRLLVYAGANIAAGTFAQVLDGIAGTTEHPMHELEERIDASGQGWFGWLDATRVFATAQMFTPPEVVASLQDAGLSNMRAIAFGAGSANGKGRLSMVLDVGENNPRRVLPVVRNELAFTTVGEPDAIVLVSIPGPDEFARLESLLLEALPDARDGWEAVKAGFSELTGVRLDELFAALGPEVVGVFDAAGDYGAIRLRDPVLFDDVLRRLSERSGTAPREQTILGQTFHHWRVPSLYSIAPQDDLDQAADVVALLARGDTHLHYIRQGDVAYFSSIPQPLMDRVRLGADTSVPAWLAGAQRIDVSSSLLAATGSIQKLPRRMYHLYIGLMQYFADLSGADYDVWAMPSAGQLGLPDEGTIGASLNFGEPYVSFELTYETQPGELLYGAGGLGAVAAAGIIAAIAIPAYQDYTIRAKVAVGLNAAAATRALVAQHYADTGAFPDADAAIALERDDLPAPLDSIWIEADTGVVVIEFLPDEIPGGGQIWLEPGVEPDGSLVFACAGSITPRYLPSACRAP